jgi:HAD superfamily hydrolase (TIGR01450 family)
MALNTKSLRVFFLDLDGVLSVGKANPRYLGGKELVNRIRESGRKVFVLTNSSTQTRKEAHSKLKRLGFSFALEEILTSSYLTSNYLTQRFDKARFGLVGESGLARELEAAGHHLSNRPQAVVVGLDRQLTYNKLDRALRFLRNGAILVGVYGGTVYMSARGPALSAGPVVRALEIASGRKAVWIGKPSPRMFRLALELANETPPHAVMIGDQIETDVVGARRAGVHTVIVLTGVESRESIKRSEIKPELVIENVDDLAKMI